MRRAPLPDFRLPSASERASVFGRTGSGKTVFMIWLLSMASIDARPWIIVDHKNDGYLAKLPRVENIKMGTLPRHPGLYRIVPKFDQPDELDKYYHRILSKGNVGIFSDEGASNPQREPRYVGLKALFAQGRSKRTPVLFGSQRPSWINMSILAESDYFAAFHLQHADDRDRVLKFMPREAEKRLDTYHSHWYDVKQDAYFQIAPVNEADALDRIERRLRPRQSLI